MRHCMSVKLSIATLLASSMLAGCATFKSPEISYDDPVEATLIAEPPRPVQIVERPEPLPLRRSEPLPLRSLPPRSFPPRSSRLPPLREPPEEPPEPGLPPPEPGLPSRRPPSLRREELEDRSPGMAEHATSAHTHSCWLG